MKAAREERAKIKTAIPILRSTPKHPLDAEQKENLLLALTGGKRKRAKVDVSTSDERQMSLAAWTWREMDQQARVRRFDFNCLCSMFCSGEIFSLDESFSRKLIGRCVRFSAVLA